MDMIPHMVILVLAEKSLDPTLASATPVSRTSTELRKDIKEPVKVSFSHVRLQLVLSAWLINTPIKSRIELYISISLYLYISISVAEEY